jgi:para-aminobenzoate synthetase component 1
VTPQALAWAWLKALPARPFTLLDSADPQWKKRFSLLAGEPLFVFEGRGSKSALRCGGVSWALRMPPEQAHAALGKVFARRKSRGFWPLVNALSYEAGGRFERLPSPRRAEPSLPDWWAYAPGLWAWWDPDRGAWRSAHAVLDPALAAGLAKAWGLPKAALSPAYRASKVPHSILRGILDRAAPAPSPRPGAPAGGLKDSMGREAYCRKVRAVQRHIYEGDIYQANLAHHFEAPFRGDAFGLYRRLSAINPSPMAAYADLGAVQVVSASPERLFRISKRVVETWPIAGTAPRRGRPGERAALRASAKDRAEHVMLVDLERNDLGRVCVAGSVRVPRFEAVESYSHVHHLVSRVRGRLRKGCGLPEVLAAGFPGGSITGAPKIRCMEIIARLERRARGWYTGSLGWWDPRRGEADMNILIRTLFVRAGRASASVGSGIVMDSDPESEWRETLSKAAAMVEALGLKPWRA